jgi:hypothetical protein
MPPARPLQTKYVRLYSATIADPGDDAGRAGTARASAAEEEGPEAGRRSPHPRSASCARNTTLTSSRRVPYNLFSISEKGDTSSFFSFRRCCGYLVHEIHTIHPSIHPSIRSFIIPCSALSSRYLLVGFLINYNRCLFSSSHDFDYHNTFFFFFLFVLIALHFTNIFSDD